MRRLRSHRSRSRGPRGRSPVVLDVRRHGGARACRRDRCSRWTRACSSRGSRVAAPAATPSIAARLRARSRRSSPPAGGVADDLFHGHDGRRTARRTTTPSGRSTGGVESVNSLTAQVNPAVRALLRRATRSCSRTASRATTPGTSATRPRSPPAGSRAMRPRPSINRGDSIDLKVNAANGTDVQRRDLPERLLRRTRARALLDVPSVPAVSQPACTSDATTGSARLLELVGLDDDHDDDARGRRGVYLLRIVRHDTGTDNQIMFVVRDDARAIQPSLRRRDVATFQAYNNYGGKSLYTFNSIRQHDRLGDGARGEGLLSTARSSSLARACATGSREHESATVYWLEQQGYDVSYISNTDLDRTALACARTTRPTSRPHTTSTSRPACAARCESARNAGVSLFFSGSNEIYWQIRFENSPFRWREPRPRSVTRPIESGGARSERDPDRHLARPGRPEQAGERAHGRDVHRRQRRGVLPARRQRSGGQRPDLPLHAAREPVSGVRTLFETLPARPGELTLLYRASNELDIVFRRELDAIAQWRGARVVYLVGPVGSDADPFVGRRLASIVPDLGAHDVYLCGPPRMMDAAHNALRRLGVRRRQVHTESFEF